MTTERDSKLVLRAEAALARASLREPDWDALAERIESSLATAAPSDESILLPPLPESVDGDRQALAEASAAEHRSDTTASPPAPGASLAELARAAVARRSSKDAVNLAKESLAIASQGRTLPEPQSRTLAEPAPAPVAARPLVEPERRTAPSGRGERAPVDTRGPWIGVAIATLGLAAGFGLYLASKRTPAPSAETKVVAVAASAPTTATTATQTATVAPAPATAVAATEPAEPSVATEPKLAEPAAASALGASALPREAVAMKSGAAPSEPRASSPPSGARAHAAKVVLEDEPAADTAHAPAKPAPSAVMRPAELNAASGMSDRPSTGAAQAAVGAVLGAARSCIAGQPEASSATIVFGSSGQVTSVSVSGPAAGTPAVSCIKSALGKARVQPFAASSFSLGVTIRPL